MISYQIPKSNNLISNVNPYIRIFDTHKYKHAINSWYIVANVWGYPGCLLVTVNTLCEIC